VPFATVVATAARFRRILAKGDSRNKRLSSLQLLLLQLLQLLLQLLLVLVSLRVPLPAEVVGRFRFRFRFRFRRCRVLRNADRGGDSRDLDVVDLVREDADKDEDEDGLERAREPRLESVRRRDEAWFVLVLVLP